MNRFRVFFLAAALTLSASTAYGDGVIGAGDGKTPPPPPPPPATASASDSAEDTTTAEGEAVSAETTAAEVALAVLQSILAIF